MKDLENRKVFPIPTLVWWKYKASKGNVLLKYFPKNYHPH